MTWVGFDAERVRITGGGKDRVRYPTNTGATRTFCGTCGSTLFYESPRWSGQIHVVRANIDGEIDRAPESHFYVDHRASWYTITDALPQFGGEDGSVPKERDPAAG